MHERSDREAGIPPSSEARPERPGAKRRERDSMSEATADAPPESDLPQWVTDMIGQPQYEEDGEFPVERGYFSTAAAVVQK